MSHKTKILFSVVAIAASISVFFFSVVIYSSGTEAFNLKNLVMEVHYLWYQVNYGTLGGELPVGTAQGLPVLVYHGITKKQTRFDMTTERFLEHMVALKRAGYRTITAQQYADFMNNGRDLPEKSFLLTFDDGREDSYYGSDPVLRMLGFNAVMFLASHNSLDHQTSSYYLTRDELKKVIKSGRWSVESHAVQFDGGSVAVDESGNKDNFLANLKWLPSAGRLETPDEYRSRVSFELEYSKRMIERDLQIGVSMFAYPSSDYGGHSGNLKESSTIIREEVSKSYSFAFRQIWPKDFEYTFNRRGEDPFLSKRLEPSPDMTGEDLVRMLANGEPKSLPYLDTFLTNFGWKNLWGSEELDAAGEKLLIKTNDAGGAFSYLDGTSWWTDYMFSMDVSASERANPSLIARFMDQKNYIRCLYSGQRVKLEAVKYGVFYTLAVSKEIQGYDENNMSLALAVEGDEVHCLLNGNDLVSVEDKDGKIPESGGIGFSLWSPGKVTDSSISNVLVTPITEGVKVALGKLEISPVKIFENELLDDNVKNSKPSYPGYDPAEVDRVLADSEALPAKSAAVSDNLVSNPDLANIDPSGDPAGWFNNLFGEISGHFALSTDNLTGKASLYARVDKIKDEAQADWYFEPIAVSAGEEYLIGGEYHSTAPSLLSAEYVMADGTFKEDAIGWLVETNSWTSKFGTIRVPEGAVSLTAYFALVTPGELYVRNVQVKLLPDGRFKNGMVTLNFDDGRETTYLDAFKLMKDNNIPATQYLISDYIGSPRYMDSGQVNELSAAGHEIASHAKTHPYLTTLSLEGMKDEIAGSKSDLEKMGYRVSSFDYPYGNVNNLVRAEVVRAGYAGARSILRGFNTKNTDPYMLRDQLVGNEVTLEQLKAMVDYAGDSRTWLILEFHGVAGANYSGGEAVDPELLSSILEYINREKIKTVTIDEGLDLMKQ